MIRKATRRVFPGRPSPKLFSAAYFWRGLSAPLVAWSLLLEGESLPQIALILQFSLVVLALNTGLAIALFKDRLVKLLAGVRFYLIDGLVTLSFNLWVLLLTPPRHYYRPYWDVFWPYLAMTLAIAVAQIRHRPLVAAAVAIVSSILLNVSLGVLNGYPLSGIEWGIVGNRVVWLAVIVAVARYVVWFFDQGAEAGASLLSRVQDSVVLLPTFKRSGSFWTISYAEKTAQIRPRVGIRYIHLLLGSPGQSILALNLRQQAEGAPVSDFPPAQDKESYVPLAKSRAGPLLDKTAKEQYRKRIGFLEGELQKPEVRDDVEKSSKFECELTFLKRELSRSTDLHGRDRHAGDERERARVSVQKAIRAAIKDIGDWNPVLRDHLDASIGTGTYCSYNAEEPIDWKL
jgi:hypothetical protein